MSKVMWEQFKTISGGKDYVTKEDLEAHIDMLKWLTRKNWKSFLQLNRYTNVRINIELKWFDMIIIILPLKYNKNKSLLIYL
jgi:hypothetical protein